MRHVYFCVFFLRGNLTSIQAFWWNLSGWILAFWKSYQLQNLQGGPRIQLQIGWNIPKKRNSYPFIRPLIGLITPLIICKPPCNMMLEAENHAPKQDYLLNLTSCIPGNSQDTIHLQENGLPKLHGNACYYFSRGHPPNRTMKQLGPSTTYVYIYYILHRS